VHDAQGVDVGQSLQQLVDEQPDQLRLQPIPRLLQHLQQIVLHILEHQVHNALLAEGLLQLHNGGVFQHLQNLDLPHGGLLDDLILLGLLELLDRHHLLVLVAPALQHHSVRALPDQSQNVVLLHNNFIAIICYNHPHSPTTTYELSYWL